MEFLFIAVSQAIKSLVLIPKNGKLKDQENKPIVHILDQTDFIINNMENYIQIKYIIGSIVYSFIGIAILLTAFWIIEKITPENLWQEIIIKQNKALAIMAAAFMLAVAIIIASAIHG